MTKVTRDWYETPHYYDIIFDEDTDTEAEFLTSVYQKHALNKTSKPLVLEPACGSGRLVKALADRGLSVDGFDLGDAMVDYAQRRNEQHSRRTRVWQDRMESFRAPKKPGLYHLAHCLVSTFKYLLTEDHARDHLRLVSQHLHPGGIYVLGVHLTDYKKQQKYEHERWSGRRGNIEVVCNTRTWPANRRTRLEKVRTRLRVRQGAEERLQETQWEFRTYNAKEMKTLLDSVPNLEHIATYDFRYDLNDPRKLDDSYSDAVLILRRR